MSEIKNMKDLPSGEGFESSKPTVSVRAPEAGETGGGRIHGDKSNEDKEVKGNNADGGRIGPKLSNAHLTSGRLLARNTVWNLIGNGAPLIVAVFSIPILIHGLGKDRFGVLALAWALIGYASLFDMGLGRALTQLVAQKLGSGEEHEIPALAWTSLLLMLGLGVVGTVVVLATAPWLVHHALKIPEALQAETVRAFYLLGLSVPLVITSTGLRGLLEAHQRFKLVSALRIPLGVFTFVGPVMVLPFSRSLTPIVGVLVAGRAASCLAYLLVCFRVVPELRRRVAWHRPSAGPLVRFGGWMTVTNIISPLMVSFDRFVLGAVVSVAAVAYYATPSEVIGKLLLLPFVIVGVLFPAFSSGFAQDRARTKLLFLRGVKYSFLAMFPVLLVLIVFAREGLTLWVGADFAAHSTVVLQWLAIGVFFNGVAQVPFALVQGVGRPDITGKLHLCEFPIYAILLWVLVRSAGIEGAAIAWTARVVVDALVLFGFSYRILRGEPWNVRSFALPLVSGTVLLAFGTLPMGVSVKVVFSTLTLFAFVLVAWFALLDPVEKLYAKTAIRAF